GTWSDPVHARFHRWRSTPVPPRPAGSAAAGAVLDLDLRPGGRNVGAGEDDGVVRRVEAPAPRASRPRRLDCPPVDTDHAIVLHAAVLIHVGRPPAKFEAVLEGEYRLRDVDEHVFPYGRIVHRVADISVHPAGELKPFHAAGAGGVKGTLRETTGNHVDL